MAKDKLKNLIDVRNTIVHGDLSTTITGSDLIETIEFFSALMDAFRDLAKSDN